jgi:hypothetical protein
VKRRRETDYLYGFDFVGFAASFYHPCFEEGKRKRNRMETVRLRHKTRMGKWGSITIWVGNNWTWHIPNIYGD